MTTDTRLAQLSAPSKKSNKNLNRKEKAAIIVRFLLNEGADVPLTELPDELQAGLTQQMGGMSYVDRDTLASVVMEFAEELEAVGLSFPRGISGALSALDGKISPLTASRLRKEAGVRQAGDPWTRLRALEAPQLLQITQSESTEVAAVILSKLDVAKAAELLGSLPGEHARRIAYAISLTSGITPEAVDRIGVSLATQLDEQAPKAFQDDPESRVGAILNFSPAATRDDVLVGLQEQDAIFADQVRRAIFTFADLPSRVMPRDAATILRDVEQETLTTVVAAATDDKDAAAVEFLLDNISSRLATQLREDAAETGEVSAKDGEAAMNIVISAVRQLEADGTIRLILPEDDT